MSRRAWIAAARSIALVGCVTATLLASSAAVMWAQGFSDKAGSQSPVPREGASSLQEDSSSIPTGTQSDDAAAKRPSARGACAAHASRFGTPTSHDPFFHKTFTSSIRVGNKEGVKCQFRVTTEDPEDQTCETIGYVHGTQGQESFTPAIKDSDIEGTDGEIVLPDQVDGQVEGDVQRTYRLTAIGEYSFAGLGNIRGTGLAGNTSIENIDTGAYSHSDITSTDLDKNAWVKTIGSSAFYWCRKLVSTGLSDNHRVTDIGEEAFLGCDMLTDTGLAHNDTLNLSYKAKEAKGVFWRCEALKDTGLGENTHLTTLPAQTFYDCYALEKTGLDRNTHLTELGDQAFCNCGAVDPSSKVPLSGLRTTGLESNSTVTTLGNRVFYGCENLRSTGLATNTAITKLPWATFQNCTALLSSGLARNRTVRSIGNNAFMNDEKLGKQADTEPVNAGDLLLKQPEQGGSLTIGSSAFSGTSYERVYLMYDKLAVTMQDSSLPDTTPGKEKKKVILYVPAASWQDTTAYPSSTSGPFKDSDGSLVVMSPGIEGMSAIRKEGTSDGALVTFVTNHSFNVQLKHARSDQDPAPIGDGEKIAVDKGGSESLTGVTVDLGADTGLSAFPEQLAAVIVADDDPPKPFVYPEGATGKDYNQVDFDGANGGYCDLLAVSFTVGFDKNDRNPPSTGGTMGDVTMVCGVTSQLPPCTYKSADPDHYKFGFWNTAADGTGKSFADKATVDGSDISKIQGQRVVLYARWVSTISMSLTVTCKGEGDRGLAGVGFLLAHSDDPHDIAREVCTDPGESHPVGDDWPQLSGRDGTMLLYGLKPGEYHVFNTRAAAGYQASVKRHVITIDEKGKVWVDTFPVDVKSFNIPIKYEFSRVPVLPSAGMLATAPARSLGFAAAILGCTAVAGRIRRRIGRGA